MNHERQERLRQLPAVHEMLEEVMRCDPQTQVPRWAILKAIRLTLAEQRQQILDGKMTKCDVTDPKRIVTHAQALMTPSLQPVINATGIVLHTNLGRAPLAKRALDRVVTVSRGYSTLEYDLDQGQRGSRHTHVVSLLTELVGAEDALIVNNNAAALLLALTALARDREVIVSRGELVEIGGSFRIPDVMAASGARLREVGTTNRTHRRDYEAAISESTAIVLKVHRSNFVMRGFTSDLSGEEIVEIARKTHQIALYDLGSGSLTPLSVSGDDDSVQRVVAQGFDLVTFSGDKLLGGPQAGIIVGKKVLLTRLRVHPLMRAVRPDKMTLAALEATLEVYRDGEGSQIPTLRMLRATEVELQTRAVQLSQTLSTRFSTNWACRVLPVTTFAGGGALPEQAFPSWAVALTHSDWTAEVIAKRLRTVATPPVIGRIEREQFLLDVRTVLEEQEETLVNSLVAALENG